MGFNILLASDLRIGNWLKNAKTEEHYQIIPADILSCATHNEGVNIWNSSIELTEDILLKCEKFATDKLMKKGIWFHMNKDYSIRFHENKISFMSCFDELYLDRCKYLHQLQNLIHSLTGEELIYKP